MNFDKLNKITAGKVKTTGISPFSELEISKVYPNPDQPRKQFEDIEELASTILEHGLLQPITVVKKDDGYMIVSGERRYRAHLHNGAKTIKAHIVNVTDEAVEELTLIENIQRNDLTDFETAKHIVKLWESGRYAKKSDLAKKIGKSDSFVSKAFSSLKLDNEILEDIETNKKDISIGVMDEIARVKDKEVQKEVYEKYSNGDITRDEIKEFKKEKKFNETFYFSNVVFTKMFFRYIEKDWIFERLNNKEIYELKIEEVLTFTNKIQDDESKISFVLDMTKQIKDAFKSKFDSFIDKKCGLLEIGKYYNITIKPKEKTSSFKLKDEVFEIEENFPRENMKKYELEICCKDGILYQSDVIEAANSSIALKKAHEKYENDFKDGYEFFVTEIKEDLAQENVEEKQKFVFTSKKAEDDKSLSFEDEGFFYFVNYSKGANLKFNVGKKYKITIEEI